MRFESRHIPLEGAKNFRDFGGYQTHDTRAVKTGMLFRSDGLHKLTVADRARLSSLSIASVCDLRRDAERQKSPSLWDDPGTTFYPLPLIGNEIEKGTQQAASKSAQSGDGFTEGLAMDTMLGVYRYLISAPHALRYHKQVFTMLGEASHFPILIHCSGGKDRTGVMCALIQWVLGVSLDDIFDDFMLSQPLYGETVDVYQAASQLFEDTEMHHWEYDALKLMFGVRREFLKAVFDVLDEHGITRERFLVRWLGCDAALIDRIKANLLTD